uniref:Uncharacterized protein n=1 Tax=Ditylenchus dipsaci TaxID=166011 RepID=A0A915DPZ2_9BILA
MYTRHTNQVNLNDSKYRCCCGVHVERAAYAIAFVGAILAAISAIFYFFDGNIGYGVGSLLNFFIYFSILYAQSKQSSGLYLPFLVLNGLAILLFVGQIVYLIIVYIYMPDWQNVPNQSYEFYSQVRLSLALYAIGTTIYTVISAWFWSWVYRAYDYMKVKNAQSPTTTYLSRQI